MTDNNLWAEYRRRRRRCLAAVLLLAVTMSLTAKALLGRPVGEILHTHPVEFILLVVVGLITGLAVFRLSNWRCPSCGKPYFLKGLNANHFTRRCLHCGLPKWG